MTFMSVNFLNSQKYEIIRKLDQINPYIKSTMTGKVIARHAYFLKT